MLTYPSHTPLLSNIRRQRGAVCLHAFSRSAIPKKVKIIQGIEKLENRLFPCVATIGNFDGVHLGHQEILKKVISSAKILKQPSVAITFKPHPQIALSPDKKSFLLNTYEEKLELLNRFDLDFVIEEPFSREFSFTSPEGFVKSYLGKKLGAKTLFLGYDFKFGKERSGSLSYLKKLAQQSNIDVNVIEPIEINDCLVSSTKIREALDAGQNNVAGMLLGRNFFLRGLVEKGVGRGHKIGFPTANIKFEVRKLPRKGVHITESIWNGKTYQSITNVGNNPTFGTKDEFLHVETHFLDFDENIYGDTIEVRFLEYLRAEQKFNSVEELVRQIVVDTEQARKFHQRRSKA